MATSGRQHARIGSSRCSRRPATAAADGDGWAFEIKWDGVRALAYRRRRRGCGSARRRGEDITPRYPELAAIADGARRARGDPRRRDRRLRRATGSPSFRLPAAADGAHRRRPRSAARRRDARSPTSPSTCSGSTARSLLAEPYERRRELLADARVRRPVAGRRPRHHLGRRRGAARRGPRARARGHRREAARQPYRPGRRSRDWVKVQNRRRQELVIGGWHARRGRPRAAASARCWSATGTRRREEAERLGRPQRLVYAGGVGTGFTQATLDELTRAARAAAPRAEPVRGRLGPRGQVRGPGPRARRAGLGRAGARLRGRVPEWTHEDTLRQPRSRACATTRTRARSCARPSKRVSATVDCAVRGYNPAIRHSDSRSERTR